MAKQTISFYTQGCRLNQSETAILNQASKSSQFDAVEFGQESDVVIVNTCTVTENGDADTRRLVNKINRTNPNAKIALIGCQAQILKDQLLSLKNVHWVVGNTQKMNILDIVSQPSDSEQVLVDKIKREPFTIDTPGIDPKHTRANIKIQDGCDFYCAFCVIPFARGPARSRKFDDILKEAEALVRAGHQEIILTGINIGTYADSKKSVLDVIDALEQIDGLNRIRISSIEPTTIPDELIHRMHTSEKLCRYLHIPLQSGCDEILDKMARKYTLDEFNASIQLAISSVPDICIGTDVIVGFPGETDALFEKTYAYLLDAPIHYFHVFTYSERKFARSKKMEGRVPDAVKAQRSARLRELSNRKRLVYMTRFLGQTVEVLFEQEKKGWWSGTTDNYLKVKVNTSLNLKNKRIAVSFTEATQGHLIGTLS